MTDHELLELAAKAAGLTITVNNQMRPGLYVVSKPNGPTEFFDPLNDDGDALRLAVKLQLQITPGTYNKDEFTAFHAGRGEAIEHWSTVQDENAATRRAIVRAASEIGKKIGQPY